MQRIIALLLCLITSTAFASERSFPHPDRIRYDGQCLTIDGKDMLIFSGAFHYFRCPKELWRDRFTKIKEAGFNCVETYVPWNVHEREQPADVQDFSKIDLTDLRDWLTMAHDEFGLYTIVRPGPYICAEWAAGGFPMWLTLKKPADTTRDPWLRSDDPTYLAWSTHWMDAACREIARHQITRREKGKTGTILVQVENEYDFLGGLTDEQRITHLKSLVRAARAGGIDVPLITCWSRQVRGATDPELREIFDGVNTYPRWKIEQTAHQLEKLQREQIDAPLMVPELQGGWFSNVGGKLSDQQDGITPEQAKAITMISLSRGATILNYYMLFGGTHFGDWAARGNTTSYDYAAAIREHGGVGEKYAVVKSIGQMLREIGPMLARSNTVACDVHDGPADVEITARAVNNGPTFVFMWNKSRVKAASGNVVLRLNGAEQQIQVAYELASFDFKMLRLPAGAKDTSNARWLPEPVILPTTRPSVPQSVKITSALHRFEDGSAATWQTAKGDLASAGVYDARYLLYRARPTLTGEQAEDFAELNLELFNTDEVVARINGRIVHPRESGGTRVVIPVQSDLREGQNEIVLLYENAGHGNFGSDTALPAGLKRGVLSRGNHMPFPFDKWAVRLIDGDRFDPALAAIDVDDSTWPRFVLNAEIARSIDDAPQPGATDEGSRNAARILYDRDNSRGVYRATANFDQAAIDGVLNWDLVFDRIDDEGVVYINGKEAAHSTKWNRPCVIPKFGTWLRPGKNVIAVEVLNTGGAGGLTRPVRFESSIDGLLLDWELSKQLPSVANGWLGSEIVEPAEWKRIELGNTPNESGALAHWYRCEFELPKLEKNIWAPWLATIAADGNGMMYLNGHPLGRYWHIGPQRKFFLPECWLKFGVGERNVLTFFLRDRPESPAVIRSIGIGADAAYAEQR